MGKIVYNGREYLSAGTASTMQGATSTTDGVSGLVPQPLIADKDKVLKGDGTWGDANEIEANPSGTATDTLQKVDIDGIIYEIQSGGGGGSNLILDAQRYSLEEEVVGIWTDGKPLYQKTINCGALPNNTDKRVQHGIQNVDCFVGVFGIAENPNINSIPIIFSNSGGSGIATVILEKSSDIIIRCNSDRSTYTKTFITLQYTKTTDTAGSGGYQAYGFSPIIYSTEEREVGVWTDNKPLYQRTFYLNRTLTNYAWNSNVLGTVNSGIDIKKYYGQYLTDGFALPIDWFRSSSSFSTATTSDNNDDINIRPNLDGVAPIVEYITIQYTKTTDTAGSGSYNMLGVSNVHYSTDEQVIGTWIDGKPLYQKTYNITLTENATYLDTSALNIKRLIELIGQCDSNNGNNALFVPYYEDSTWRMIPGMDYANQQLSIVTTATVLQYYSKLSITIKYTKTTD